MTDAKLISRAILTATLDLTVPMWIERVRHWSKEQRADAARVAADTIAAKGDVLQFGGGKKGEAAEAFNALARGLAVLAFVPGGVKFAGRHWTAEEKENE